MDMDIGIANHQILKYNFGIDPEGSLCLVLSLKIGILSVNIFEIFNQNWPFYVGSWFHFMHFSTDHVYLNLHMYTNQQTDALDEPCTFHCPL